MDSTPTLTESRWRDVKLLRETATSMREEHPASHPRHEMWFELASLIESVANSSAKYHTTPLSSIMRVARAYQAARTRPDIDGSIQS